MSLSFTFCTFGCVESTMNGDDKGGRTTARRQVSKVPVAKPTGSGKKVLTIGGGLDLDNIVSTGRRGNARNARGLIASASSTGKRRTALEAASAAAAGTNVTKKQKASSPVQSLQRRTALSGENIDDSSPVQESSSLPDLDHPYTTHSGMDASKAQVLNDYAGHFNAGHMIHVLRSDFQEECVTTVEETTGWRKSMLLQQHITRQVHFRGLTLAFTLRNPPPPPIPPPPSFVWYLVIRVHTRF